MTTSSRFIDRAEQAAGEAETWANLSNFLFDPGEGLIARAYPTREAREAFVKTEEYRKLRQLVADSVDRHGLVEGGTPKKSGRFVVRLPRSLHAALGPRGDRRRGQPESVGRRQAGRRPRSNDRVGPR